MQCRLETQLNFIPLPPPKKTVENNKLFPSQSCHLTLQHLQQKMRTNS